MLCIDTEGEILLLGMARHVSACRLCVGAVRGAGLCACPVDNSAACPACAGVCGHENSHGLCACAQVGALDYVHGEALLLPVNLISRLVLSSTAFAQQFIAAGGACTGCGAAFLL